MARYLHPRIAGLVAAIALALGGFAAFSESASADRGTNFGGILRERDSNGDGTIGRTIREARETVSNEAGFYVFSNMTPGLYEVKFEAKGFCI